jgi:hypothetical protein
VLIDYSNLGASVSSKIRSSSSVNEIPPTGLSGIGSDYNVQKPHKLAHFQTVKRYYDKYIIKAGYRKLKSLRHHPRRTPNLTFGLELEMIIPGCREDEGFKAVLTALKQLYRAGAVRYDAVMEKNHFRDRKKYVVMADSR